MALVSSEKDVRERMEKGRGITDPNWIQSSVDYNQYFLTHKSIGDMPFETIDTEGKSVEEVAEDVRLWMLSCLNKE